MKSLKLITSAYVGGVLRHPHEGVIHVRDEDAQRVLDDKAAVDVTADFGKQAKDLPPEPVSIAQPLPADVPAPAQHQSEVAPQAVETPLQPASPAPANKE